MAVPALVNDNSIKDVVSVSPFQVSAALLRKSKAIRVREFRHHITQQGLSMLHDAVTSGTLISTYDLTSCADVIEAAQILCEEDRATLAECVRMLIADQSPAARWFVASMVKAAVAAECDPPTATDLHNIRMAIESVADEIHTLGRSPPSVGVDE